MTIPKITITKADGRIVLTTAAAAAFLWMVYTQQATSTEILLIVQGVFNWMFNGRKKEAE